MGRYEDEERLKERLSRYFREGKTDDRYSDTKQLIEKALTKVKTVTKPTTNYTVPTRKKIVAQAYQMITEGHRLLATKKDYPDD